MSSHHEFQATLLAGEVYTEETAKSMIGQHVPVHDGMSDGGVSVEAGVPYEVMDAWLDAEGRVVGRLRADWADDDPRMIALQKVRRFIASGEFERRFMVSFDESLAPFLKRDDKLVQERARPEPLTGDLDDLPPDLLG